MSNRAVLRAWDHTGCMDRAPDDLEIVEFATVGELRAWLAEAGSEHPGVWVRLARSRSARNERIAAELERGGRLTEAGRRALGM